MKSNEVGFEALFIFVIEYFFELAADCYKNKVFETSPAVFGKSICNGIYDAVVNTVEFLRIRVFL